MGDKLLYLLARAVIGALQLLPLPWVARLGRFIGGTVHLLDARHRKVVLKNLRLCFAREKSEAELRAIAKENFRRIGENFACAVKTAGMPWAQLQEYCQFTQTDHLLPKPGETGSQSRVIAIGHFGNFELYARFGEVLPGFQGATTYRGLRQPSLNRLLQNLRAQSGCLFFERRTDGAALRAAMHQSRLILGLLSDQHAGDNGLMIPFFGVPCSTSNAPAIFALRYDCPLFTGFCYRVGLGRWRLEAGDEIPTHADDKPRPIADITLDVNRAFEAAIRRDPANWFWVHNRWKAWFKLQAQPPAAPALTPALAPAGANPVAAETAVTTAITAPAPIAEPREISG